MARWTVELDGAPEQLTKLVRHVPSGSIYAIEESGRFFLVGSVLDNRGNASSDGDPISRVQGEAEQRLKRLTAVVSMKAPPFALPKVKTIWREDATGRMGYANLGAKLSGNGGLHARISVQGATPESEGETDVQRILGVLENLGDLHLNTALELRVLEPGWGLLYRVLEEVEAHLTQGVVEAGLSSRAQRTRFTRTANSAEMAGDGARHAQGKFDLPSDPMTLDEAVEWVDAILVAVFRRLVDSWGLGQLTPHASPTRTPRNGLSKARRPG